MVSDDTEHAFFVTQCLLACPQQVSAFQSRLAWALRSWLLGLPAGIGFATLRALLKLWLGFPPRRSGVFSAGNGPAMRSAPIGIVFAENAQQRCAYVRAATCLTHTDEKAYIGALAMAELSAYCWRGEADSEQADVQALNSLLSALAVEDSAWQALLTQLFTDLELGCSVAEFAAHLGLERGVSGYVYHSVPVAIYAWLHHWGDYRAALTAVYRCGGDTDTVGAMAGALCGVHVGHEGIPQDWRESVCEWPRSMGLLGEAAQRLAQLSSGDTESKPVCYFWPGLLLRNAVFLLLVLGHGLRRLWPW